MKNQNGKGADLRYGPRFRFLAFVRFSIVCSISSVISGKLLAPYA
ncbi:MAG TPA: hypothetical protein VLV31_06175 [Candidatus Acidoferrales bacterium]|nr:hypothetical protein [Candidatus Acidoferrales bacterium]